MLTPEKTTLNFRGTIIARAAMEHASRCLERGLNRATDADDQDATDRLNEILGALERVLGLVEEFEGEMAEALKLSSEEWREWQQRQFRLVVSVSEASALPMAARRYDSEGTQVYGGEG